MTSVLWFRRDLRLADHPALDAAAAAGEVLGVFVIDPALWAAAGPVRRAWLAASLLDLRAATGDRLLIRYGDPAVVLADLAATTGAEAVHITAETTPYGRRRDARVATALAASGVGMLASGTPYAVDPGRLHTLKGEPYRVFTPFSRAWRDYGWPVPLGVPEVSWLSRDSDPAALDRLETALTGAPDGMPRAGEEAAGEQWRSFRNTGITGYDQARDLPGSEGTSRLSPYLKVGAIHPRTLLADLDHMTDPTGRFTTELAWREFYADVLWHHPGSAWTDLRPLDIGYDEPRDALAAWQAGMTGFPIVDAGVRQMLHTGWMHNRVRMIVASFLTKDLHAWWPTGARYFLDHLIDGDLASNSHGWQWVAGTGTDAAPYFRVFNPITQGLKFDPDGSYVRRWIPELSHLPGAEVHEPWKHRLGYEGDYPRPIVDHAAERVEALARYADRRGPNPNVSSTS